MTNPTFDVLALKDRVWRLRSTLLYEGFDNPSKTHHVVVSQDLWDLLGLRKVGVIGFDGLVTIHRLYGLDIDLDESLPPDSVNLVLRPEEDMEV